MVTSHKVRVSGTSSRILNETEELVIRLCHHDHGGESIEDAAVYMDMTFTQVGKVIRRAQKKAPQLFPILFPIHRAVLELYSEPIGFSRTEISGLLGITLHKLERIVTFLREHGFMTNRKPDQYRPYMDTQVAEVF